MTVFDIISLLKRLSLFITWSDNSGKIRKVDNLYWDVTLNLY